eukprot:SAG31_NODE_3083_length_4696_cov_3.351751_1_plen_41_part_00
MQMSRDVVNRSRSQTVGVRGQTCQPLVLEALGIIASAISL